MHAARGLVAIAFGSALSLAVSTLPAAADTCQPDTIGPDLSLATTYGGVYLGQTLGQTFLARDTLLTSLTVWRSANQNGFANGIKVYFARVDSTGRPDVHTLLFDGLTVHANGDGINPTPYVFVFDPPVVLPGVGTYEFGLRSDPCDSWWDIRAAEPSVYADGSAWDHSRSLITNCPPRIFPGRLAGDVIFKMTFCSHTTPTKSTTWGQLKAIYR